MKTRKTKSTMLGVAFLAIIMLCVTGCNKSDDPNNGGNDGNNNGGGEIEAPDVWTFNVDDVKFDMIKVQGGTFWMGSQKADPNGQNYNVHSQKNESPVHQVTLSDYYIGKFEVTQELWKAVMGTNPSEFQGELLPVENVGWNAIRDFLFTINSRLNEETQGMQFRLPTEAQWEYAARGGKNSRGYQFSGGDDMYAVGWFHYNSERKTHPVGGKEPNELFLYDMSGNVMECCSDNYAGYVGAPQTDPIGSSQGEATVIKGGYYADYNDSYGSCRVAARRGWEHSDGYSEGYQGLGLRLVLSNSEGQANLPGAIVDVDEVTTSSALIKGMVVSDCGSPVTEAGFYYGTSPDPVMSGVKWTASEWDNGFDATIENLLAGTKYYVCSYAKNEVGIGYGEVKEFSTLIHISTSDVRHVTSFSAVCGGNVIGDGGIAVSERGVCWSMAHNPTITDSHFAMGAGVGTFSVYIAGLLPSHMYYVRAYAINSLGIVYGDEMDFNTLPSKGNSFTINSEGDKVYFSQGNLQYQASSNTWRFAENQYDIIGEDNVNISSSYDGWIDLFGWGTSGYNHGAVCYQPWSTSAYFWDYYAYGDYYGYDCNLYDQTGQADWGYNAISNGGNMLNCWRTLNKSEWEFICNTRLTASGIRFVKACVNGVNGVIILPDDWNESNYSLNNTNMSDANYNSNFVSLFDWVSLLESKGAVFLPAGGSRHQTTDGTGIVVAVTGNNGRYWSSSSVSNGMDASLLDFKNDDIVFSSRNRSFGMSVRLVCPAE